MVQRLNKRAGTRAAEQSRARAHRYLSMSDEELADALRDPAERRRMLAFLMRSMKHVLKG